jgi:hypothetical protein
MRRLIVMAAALGLLAAVPFAALGASPKGAAKTPHHHFAGAVTAVGSDSLTIDVLWTGKHDTQLLNTSVTVAVDGSTALTSGKAHTGIALGDVKPGDLVGVGVTSAGSDLTQLTAVRVHVGCNCHWIGGTLSSVGSSSVVVQVAKTGPFDTVLKGQAVTLQLNGSTLYVQGKAKTPISLGDLKTGDRVGVVFGASGFFKAPGFDASTATFTAKRIRDWGVKATVPGSGTDASAAATPSL